MVPKNPKRPDETLMKVIHVPTGTDPKTMLPPGVKMPKPPVQASQVVPVVSPLIPHPPPQGKILDAEDPDKNNLVSSTPPGMPPPELLARLRLARETEANMIAQVNSQRMPSTGGILKVVHPSPEN